MAEGFARAMAPAHIRVYSAGSAPARLNPYAVQVMQEAGIDISFQYSKSADDIPQEEIETVITLCAEEVCSVFRLSVERLHWPFNDPAAETGSEESVLAGFRRVRDEIRAAVETYFRQRRG